MRYLEKAVTLSFDDSKCNGCGMCTRVCPHGVFVRNNGKAVMADRGACMECGACMKNCEPGAITVRAGVGCASAVLKGLITGTEPECGCSNAGGKSSTCC